MHDLNQEYQDRGMKKWSGFYLSDHTSKLNSQLKKQNKLHLAKELMSFEEINLVLDEAQLKTKDVRLQLEAVDAENNYFPDICGPIQGYDSLGIYINSEKVHYDEIRHIRLDNTQKWSTPQLKDN